MYSDDLFLYDWFSVTAKHHSADTMVDWLGLDMELFKPMGGFRGYKERLYFDGISIHHGSRDEVWLEMSGQGCRAFETFGHGGWDTLFDDVMNEKEYHMTRLDVAFDDHTGILNLDKLFHDAYNENFIQKFQDWCIQKGNKGVTVYHGSPRSDILFRIYDKAKERGREDEGHWVRFEMQLRDDRASNFLAKNLLQPIGEVFTGVVNNYLRYVRPTNDSNRRRWPMTTYWKKFIGIAGKLTLYETPGIDYNLGKLQRFAVRQAGAAAATYIEIVGLEKYLEEVHQRKAESINPKYDELLRQYVDSDLLYGV